jgi:hypothetical protein
MFWCEENGIDYDNFGVPRREAPGKEGRRGNPHRARPVQQPRRGTGKSWSRARRAGGKRGRQTETKAIVAVAAEKSGRASAAFFFGASWMCQLVASFRS